MSFSKKVKKELSQIEPEKQCCLAAQSYGLLLFGRSFSSSSIRILTESEDVARMYTDSSLNFTGIEPTVEITKSGKYSVKFTSQEDRGLILNSFGHSSNDVTLRINRANFEDDCCYGAFIRGAFMSCGTITDPNRNYHIEFVVQHQKLAGDLMAVLKDVEIEPKLSRRGNNYVVYCKYSNFIEDILTLMGAVDSSLDVMGIKMVKSVRNKINRQINFETANMSRTIDASLLQIVAIEKIREKGMFDSLPEQLRTIAKIRLENPDMSLGEIQKEIGDGISRSGVNHRLNKLVKIAQELD